MNSNQPSQSGVDRRDFLKTTAAVAGAGMAVSMSGLSVARSAWQSGSDELKVALVGCGGRGSGAAVQALRADKGTKLIAMSDVFADRLASSLDGITKEITDSNGADGAKAKIDVPKDRQFVGFESYKQAIDAGPDVVILTSYPNFRPAHLRYAVDKGKHIFAEKPVAVDAVGIRDVLAATEDAKKKNTALMVGFCWRHHPGMRAAFEQIQKGLIGDVVGLHTNYHGGTLAKHPRKAEWSDTEFQLRNWWHFTWISGDHVVEQAIHSIDRMQWAMSDKAYPKQVVCLGGRAARNGPEHGNVYDHFAAIYEYEGGGRAHHTCRQMDGCPSDNSDYVYGTKGRAHINGFNNIFKCWDYAGKETWRFKGAGDDEGDMYQNEHNELFKSIRAGKPINDGERSTKHCLMGIMARMAAYTGQTVTWEQAMNSKENLQPAKLEWGPMAMPEVAVPGKYKLV